MSSLISRFFDRIHYQGSERIRLNDLDRLMFQYAKHVPFENSSVLKKNTVPINLDYLKKRILDQSRGGICYELNPFFYYILKEVGFNVSLLAATIFGNEAHGLIRTHVIVLLHDKGAKYLIDVGSIAHAALQPIPFTDTIMNAYNERFRVRACKTEYGTHMLEKFHDHELETGYYFDLNPIDEAYLNKIQKVIQSHPHTLLNQSLLLSKVTDTGRETLTQRSFTVTQHGKKSKQTIDEEAFQKLSSDRFGMIDIS